ncbi:MAG: tetratricopeptide repeat protein [Myxococcales bacterium]|nr:tetratricopeptide repeat protein [Myxococcales bacterium]
MSNVDRRWLAGPVSDLLWGCGLAYFPVLIMLVLAGPQLQALIPLGLLPFGNIVLSIPHYGATLLRVYERREDRQKYSFFTVHLTILVWGLFTVGLFQPTVGSAMYTVYLTWSPWHYAGQNYGLASMFLRRRGIEITPWTRRALRASFLLSFALSFLAMHIGDSTGATYAPTPMSAFGDFHFYALGLPAAVAGRVAGLVLVMYVACLGVAAVGLLRRASLADITPTALLVLSQALWFTVPIIARSEGFGIDTVAFNLVDAQYSFWWIAFAHSVQYLWVTRYFARSGGAGHHYFTRATFAGFAVFGLPVLLFTATGLTPVPYDAGLFLLVNTAVNLHHFILDGAIWKLRDGAVARVLLRPVEPSKQVDPGSRGLPWRRIAVVVVASLYMVQYVVNAEEKEFGVNRADGASERLRSAERRLARIRLPSPTVSARLGIALANDGKLLEAEAALERSIDQRASALAWTALGQVRARQKDWPGAEEALTQAIALEPDQRSALHELGQVRFTAGDAAGAIAPLERALELSDGEVRRNVALLLQRAQSAVR